MAKGRKPDITRKRSDENELQFRSRMARHNEQKRDRERPIVSPEAERHGQYAETFVTHVETGTKTQTKLNRGGTPYARWKASGRLTDTQIAAIDRCIACWERLETNPHTTSSYGPRTGGGGDVDAMTARTIDARDTLTRYAGYVGPGYWDIFENVCRWDMASGKAGEALGCGTRSAQARAQTVVMFVADIIAMNEGL